jgi:hypothetical protein
MLQYTKSSEPATFDGTIMRGRDILRAMRSKRRRAQLAIDVIEDRATIADLTKKQIARALGVPVGYVRALRNVSGRRRTGLVEAWLQASAAERLEAAHAFDVKWMWVQMTEPLLHAPGLGGVPPTLAREVNTERRPS